MKPMACHAFSCPLLHENKNKSLKLKYQGKADDIFTFGTSLHKLTHPNTLSGKRIIK